MARIWQEGFEDGLPYTGYLEGSPNSQFIGGLSLTTFPNGLGISTGRNTYSLKSLKAVGGTGFVQSFSKTLDTSSSELYFRVYYKHEVVVSNVYDLQEFIYLSASDGNKIISIYNNDGSGGTTYVKVRKAGSYATTETFTLSTGTWHKIEFYVKISATVGAY